MMKFQTSARIVLITIVVAILDRVVVGRVHEPTQPEVSGEGQEENDTKEEKIILGWDVETYTNTSIVGGQQSDPDEFPYFVDLTICAGSLISPRVVLTAAHCKPENFIGRQVTVGAYKREDRFDTNKRITVIDAISHPWYGRKKPLNNDFGLLLLDRPYYINSPIKVVVNVDNQFPEEGAELKAIGMGTTSYQGSISDTLRDVSIPAILRRDCRKTYTGQLTRRMMCAGIENAGKDACQGDSGGPLVQRVSNTHYLVGITSWGRNCGINPGVYSQVSRGSKWIRYQVCNIWKEGTPELCARPAKAASVCQDSSSFAYNDDPEKNCAWAKEKPRLRCRLEVGEQRIRHFCKESCGKCKEDW